MKIVSFNVNGLRARFHQLQALVERHQPDVLGLQEIKVHDSEFPAEDPDHQRRLIIASYPLVNSKTLRNEK